MNRKILMQTRVLTQVQQIRYHQSRVLLPTKKFLHLPDLTSSKLTVNLSRGTNAPFSRYTTVQDKQGSASAMSATQYTVDHDTKNQNFYIVLQGSGSDVKAKLEYDWISPTLVDMYHTEVPPQFQGKGIAKYLAKAAFDHFSEEEVTMRPSCTYLQKYLRENPLPKYTNHVEKGFTS